RAMSLAAMMLGGIAVAGCASWTVKSEGSAAAPYGQYRTYAWTTPPGAGAVDRLLDQRVRDAVAVDLAKRGIRPAADSERPDFFVDYSASTGALIQTIVTPAPAVNVGASGGTYVPPLPLAMTYTYQQEKLMLDFIDARSGRVFWRGFAAYGSDRPAEVSTPKAAEAVDKILRKYPAPQVARASRPSG
ncbi:MAG: DUF4136 domain-containing protein, partial [Polyangia bacterium]